MSEDIFMSADLVNRVTLEKKQDDSYDDIEKNTAIFIICPDDQEPIIGGARYFKRESDITSIEVSCQFYDVAYFIKNIESNKINVLDLEFHKGDDILFSEKFSNICGYYVSDIDPITGKVLFGLKLEKQKAKVL